MDEDQESGRRLAQAAAPRVLAGLSIEELEAYVHFLEQEKVRTLREIEERRDVRGAAEALFRKPGED